MRVKKELDTEDNQRARGPRLRWLGLALLALLLLAGCEGLPPAPVVTPRSLPALTEPTATSQPTPTPQPTALPTPEATPEAAVVPRGGAMSPTELIERAKAEAAKLARSSADSLQVVSVEAIDWSDSSLGCPKAGMMYAQVITPGYKIVLALDGVTYEFHTATNPTGPLVHCGG